MPRVSLALPVHNGENYVADAIASILAQSFRDFELIITDNASNDRTEAICRRFVRDDGRVRYHRNELNLGAAENFNLGVRLASGTLFKWCAHDDRLSDNYLEACVAALAANPDAILAHGRQCGIDANGRETGWTSGDIRDVDGIANPAERFRLVFTTQGFDVAMFGVMRTAVLRQTSLHRKYYGSDIALLAELALLGPFVSVENAIFYNRDHPARSINASDKRERQLWHDAGARRVHGLEHIGLLRHLLAIAYKHRATVPLRATARPLLFWAASYRQLARYGLELIGLASPALQSKMRVSGRRLAQSLGRPCL